MTLLQIVQKTGDFKPWPIIPQSSGSFSTCYPRHGSAFNSTPRLIPDHAPRARSSTRILGQRLFCSRDEPLGAVGRRPRPGTTGRPASSLRDIAAATFARPTPQALSPGRASVRQSLLLLARAARTHSSRDTLYERALFGRLLVRWTSSGGSAAWLQVQEQAVQRWTINRPRTLCLAAYDSWCVVPAHERRDVMRDPRARRRGPDRVWILPTFISVTDGMTGDVNGGPLVRLGYPGWQRGRWRYLTRSAVPGSGCRGTGRRCGVADRKAPPTQMRLGRDDRNCLMRGCRSLSTLCR